ncbi:kinase-like domain-containing protein, partial [Mycena rosella]
MPPSNDLPILTGRLVDEGRLRLLEILGSGSYGVVYKALDASSPPDAPVYYAVKCLGFGTRADQREIDLHTLCSSHPSVVTFHRHFYAHGCLCVVLELSAGGLWTAIENGAFENKNAFVKETFLQLVDAVHFCHERGVHHRDLKPENILCGADGKDIRIADFGLAVDDVLPCFLAAGTPSYMPPEAFTLSRTSPTYEGYQSDIWALGIVFINMICGGFPWLKAARPDPGWQSFLASPTYISRNCPISPQLNDLLRRCFNPIPTSRPSLLELRSEI